MMQKSSGANKQFGSGLRDDKWQSTNPYDNNKKSYRSKDNQDDRFSLFMSASKSLARSTGGEIEKNASIYKWLNNYSSSSRIKLSKLPLPKICYKNVRFLIMDRPSDATMTQLVEQLQSFNVKDVIRVCEPSYKLDQLERAAIAVHDFQFDDGSAPKQEIIDKWLDLIRVKLESINEQVENTSDNSAKGAGINSDCCLAVHCVAGLGRGPVLVAIALMELGMKYEDAIEFIRARRRGAFNQKQLKYLSTYRPQNKLKCCLRGENRGGNGCSIM